ncbi:hypothetical protein ACFYW6_38835 [Streptomyces sp. NPDC002659]|uniref:hypothetical protein n=1 Tax=Streptomyces sp. NPDC002659 TaxID=3364656 RepID=UPI0036871A36
MQARSVRPGPLHAGNLRKHDTLEQIAAGFRIGVATAWRDVNDTIELLGRFAPSLTEALTNHHGDGYVLLDGTVAETDRIHTKGHYSGKVRREGVNRQVITADEGLPRQDRKEVLRVLRRRTAGLPRVLARSRSARTSGSAEIRPEG